MTDYTYSKVAVYAELGGALRLARNSRAFATDPVTGVPVNVTQGAFTAAYFDTDSSGIADFTATTPGPIRLTTGATFVDVYSEQLPGDLLAAEANAAASAASAALSASLVGAPADTAVAAIVGNPASATRVSLDSIFSSRGTIVVEAKDHGVLADGSTDDAPALNALITTVAAAGGGRILLPKAATVRVNSAVVLASNVSIEGHGWDTVVSLGANIAGSAVITVGAISNAAVRNIKLLGNRTTYTSLNSGVLMATPGGCTNIDIENVWVAGVAGYGIAFLGDITRATVSTGVRIVDCKITDAGAHGIICQWAIDNAHIRNCVVEGYAQSLSDQCGITIGRFSYDVSITDCTVDGTGALGSTCNGISMDEPMGRAVCSRNTVRNAVGLSLEIGGCYDITVADNVITDCIRTGIMFTGYVPNESATLGAAVHGNVITRCANGIGVSMGGTLTGIATPATKRIQRSRAFTINTITVEGRRLYKVTTAGTTSATAPTTLGTTVTGATVTDGTVVFTDLGVTNSALSITGNVIRSCTNVGIDIVYAHGFAIVGNQISRCAQSGIRIASNANMFTITGNDLDGNNTSGDGVHGNLKIETLTGVAHVGEVSSNSARDSGLNGTDLYYVEASARFDNRILVNATAPTVAFSDVFQTANTGATSITYFVDPNARTRRIIVFVNDAFTTFVHSASGTNTIRLVGGVNYTPPVNTVMEFAMTNGAQWFEVSRVTTG